MNTIGIKLVSLLCITGLIAACGSGGGTTDTDSGGGTATTSSNSLGEAYPSDLAVSSPTASSSSSTSLNKSVDGVLTAEATPPPITEQKQKIQNILNATSKTDCKFTFDLSASPPAANCYGPNLNYTNHPDRSGGENPNGQLPPGDLGIWEENNGATSEACVAAKMNNLVGEIITNVRIATEMGAAILCAANLAGLKLPDKGASVDLQSVAQSTMTDNGVPMTISTATLSRAASDATSDRPIFTMAINGALTFSVQGQGSQSSEFQMTLRHVPKAIDNNDTYDGRLSLQVNIPNISFGPFALGNCSGANGLTDAFSIEYSKTSATSLTYALKRAEFCGKDASPFDSNKNIDLSKKKSGSQAQGWGNDGNFALFNINPEDGTGNFAYAWQAGANDGNTRVLEVKVTKSGSAVSGCGYFGYGPDIAATSGVGSIDRMICNWAGPGNSHTGVTKAQRQCFSQSSGKMVSDSSNLAIRYAPTNACDKTAAQNFSYATSDNSSSVAASENVTNNLIGLSDIDVTVPTAPSIP